jgi:hypothetical protein
VNEPSRVLVTRRGWPGELVELGEREDRRCQLAADVAHLRLAGGGGGHVHPFVDAMMPDGSRLHVVIPVSTRPADTSAS